MATRPRIFVRCYLFLSVILAIFSPMSIEAQSTDYSAKARELVSRMTLEEKASLLSGRDMQSTRPIERLGIPSISMCDGPNGLRKSDNGSLVKDLPATAFPTASAMAATWDTDLIRRVGKAIGEEAQANHVQILLGPGVNMKRSPLGGRNFEYYSEDPVLAGKMAAAFIEGLQSQGVGASLKHFVANNQEYERMSASSDVDERTLREIYLRAFEIAVKEAQPWTVMCSYNKVNGVYASENPFLLNDVLKKEWGLKGIVVSDWGAVNDRVEGVKAGLHLEMPGTDDAGKIVEAVKSGALPEARLDEIVTELLAVILRAADSHRQDATFDAGQHNELARRVAGESIVLLKNSGGALPLDMSKIKNIAVIGDLAKKPHFEGDGSSHVTPIELSNPYDELEKIAGTKTQISFAQGYSPGGASDEKQIAEAQKIASRSDVAIVFAGLPDGSESEGFDRKSIDLPEGQNQLIEAVAKAQRDTIVVLMNGSAVAMPWASDVRAILEGWLGGQAGGTAIADVLTGRTNPSGKLSETFPKRLEDTPAFPNFPATNGEARYGEGLFIGYRYYDKKKIEPLFPFGYGLSYTTFAYTSLKVDRTSLKDTDTLSVEVTVKNTGRREGKEVVELFVGDRTGKVLRPEKELKAFAKVELKPGEEKTLAFHLGFRDFAYYDEGIKNWVVESGKYEILAGGSSRDLPLQQTVEVESTNTEYAKLTRDSTIDEFARNPKGKFVYQQIISNIVSSIRGSGGSNAEETEAEKKAIASMEMMIGAMPIKRLVPYSQGRFTEAMLEGLLKMVNH